MTGERELSFVDVGPQPVPVLTCCAPECPSAPDLSSRAHLAHEDLLAYLRAAVEEYSAPGCDRQLLLLNVYASLGALCVAAGEDLSRDAGLDVGWTNLLTRQVTNYRRLYAELRAAPPGAPPA